MAPRYALICSGQGAQDPAMFNFARQAVGAQIDAWLPQSLLGRTLESALLDPAALFGNLTAQPLIVAATLANWAALRASLPMPFLVLGYSVGELSACSIAGALPADAAVRLAAVRAQLMQACTVGTPRQGMLSASGRPIADLLLAERHGLSLAIRTGDDSAILGGLQQQIFAFEAAAPAAGVRASLLPIEIASHTAWMGPARAPFAAALADAGVSHATIRLLRSLDGGVMRESGAIREALRDQLAAPIQWAACMDACAEAGVTAALELGPGAGLSRMLQERHPQIRARSVTQFRSVEGVRRWLEQD